MFKKIKRIKRKIHLPRRKQGRSQEAETEVHPSAIDEPTLNPPIINGQPAQTRLLGDLWNLAYENLREEDGDLIVKYEKKLCGDLSAGLSSTLGSAVNMRDRMHAILDRKVQEVKQDIWKLKFQSTEVQIRDLSEPVLGAISWANEYVAQAVSTNPYASIAWVGVSLLLPLLLNPSEQGASLAKGLEYVSSLIARTRTWEELYDRRYEELSSQHDLSLHFKTPYRNALEKLYRQILKFQVTSYCYYASSTFSRLGKDMVKWNEWDTLLDEIKEGENEFTKVSGDWRDKEYSIECAATDKRHQEAVRFLQTIETDLSGLRKAVQDAQEEKKRNGFLDWLCTADPSGMYNAARDKHESGTCEWLLRESKEFKTWQESSKSLLWLHGKAGSGKSILSSSVVEYLQEQHRADPGSTFAYFFFSFSDQEKQKVTTMLESLVKQLYASRPDTPKAVEDLGQYKTKGMRPDTKALENALMATARGFSSVSIVIDALDECPALAGERRSLLRSLSRIIEAMPDNFHVFCTSRTEADIKEAISGIMYTPSRAAIDLSNNRMSIERDIGLYIDSEFASIDYNSWPKELKGRAKKLLIEKSDGMFQYIFCQFVILRDLHSSQAIDRALKELPSGLDATYDRMLRSLNTKYQAQILSLLKWLAVSNRDLSLEELTDAFIIRTDPIFSVDIADRLFEPKHCLTLLSSLVVTQETAFHRTLVRLAHFSLREYLTSERITNGPAARFGFPESDAQLHVALSCLIYHLHGASMAKADAEDLKLKAYAASGWMSHLGMVPHEQWPKAITELAIRALTAHSRSLDTIISFSRKKIGYNSRGIDWSSSEMLMRPQCLTARLGHFKLTEMLLYSSSKINRYLTRWDLDMVLRYAAYGGHTEVVQLILDRSIRPNVNKDTLGNALLAAAYAGRANIVDLLLDNGADINVYHSELGSPLQAAVFEGCPEVVRLLVRRGADVNLPPNEARSALASAVPWMNELNKSTEILEFLLNSGAIINGQGDIHGTALHQAAAHLDLAREHFYLLIKMGADVNADGGKYGYPLQAACNRYSDGNAVEIGLLLDKGADVNAQGGVYGNALQAACSNPSDGKHIKLMLDRGANANAQGGQYGNALQALCYHQYRHRNYDMIIGVIAALLERGADINAQGGELGTALQAACSVSSSSIRIVKFLLENGANPNIQGGKYGNALQAACVGWNRDVVQLLLDHGVNINALGGQYETALQAAARKKDILELLLSRGADINQRGGYYGTALYAAHHNIDAVRLLLDRGAEVNAEGGECGTALQAACNYGHLDIVRLLIEHGADIHLQGGEFGSAWHATVAGIHGIVIYGFDVKRHDEILQLLLDNGVDVNDTRGPGGPTALHSAVKAKANTKITSFLLSQEAIDVNINPGAYGSPLQSACAVKDNDEQVALLLRECLNIDVNASGGTFGSALQAAAHSGQTSSVQLLLERGAHINARGGECRTALNAAVFKGFWDIVELLLEHGAKSDRQQSLELDEEWLARIEKEDGEEAVARYRVFWEKQP
ncbi:ankyrin repeat-containing domain protein [Nemania sp. FL0031]|nr:ankyrin repeat-containing domain protein [Nemania sp. FL0031]